MNRLTSGMASLFALLLVAGCGSEPTGNLRDGVQALEAAPSQIFLQLGESKPVDVRAVDDQGNRISSSFTVTSTGPGITVRRDSTFLPVYVDDTTLTVPPEAPVFRFIVTAQSYTATSFTVSANGKDVVVPVQVVAQSAIGTTFSSTTPALGDTITLAAPAGTSFSQTSTLTIPGATLQPLIVYRSATNDTIKFLAPPNINSPLTISEVTNASAPGLVFSPATAQILTTPLFDSLDVGFSNATPNVGQTVTVTLPSPLIKFQPTTTLAFPDELAAPANILVSADSNTLTFEAPPNATGAGLIDSLIFPGGFALSLPTRPTITAQNIGTTVPAGLVPAAPNVNQTVTLTAPVGFTFAPDATLSFGGNAPEISSQSVGSISFLPAPATTAPATITGLILNSAPQFTLTMESADTLTVSATIPTLAGSDAQATAPTIPTPAVGGTTAIYDKPDFAATADHFYKLVVGTAGDYTITMDWTTGSDVDMFVCPAPVAPGFANCDFTAATGDHPESATYTLAAGTYIIVSDDFGADAVGTTLHVSVSR
jgi:hypothetical protein